MLKSDEMAQASIETPDATSENSSGSTGVMALIAALTMLFAALCSAYIVRRGLSSDWTPLPLPKLAWASALASILGSAILEFTANGSRRAGRRLAAALGCLGGVLLIASWNVLSGRGLSVASNPAAAFYLVFGSVYLVCLGAGIVAVLGNGSRVSHLYWHYLTGLWTLLVIMFEVWP